VDGDLSFLVLTFTTSWQAAAEQMKSSLIAAGWTCSSCLPFETPTPTKATENWRYLLNMTQGDRKLIGVVSERNGTVSVSLNFAA
jgi:hypothetical protein